MKSRLTTAIAIIAGSSAYIMLSVTDSQKATRFIIAYLVFISVLGPWGMFCARKELKRLQGPRGQRGHRGLRGYPGVEGEPGETGLAGAQGEQGVPGPPGTVHGVGAGLGIPGPAGPAGPAGEAGEAGEAGGIGLTGLTGKKGVHGDVGLTGDTGDTGKRGFRGMIGKTGPEGLVTRKDLADFQKAVWRALVIFALALCGVAAAFGVLFNRTSDLSNNNREAITSSRHAITAIQDERAGNIYRSCQEANQRNRNAVKVLKTTIANTKFPTAAARAQAEASIKSTRLLIDALTPHHDNCRAYAATQVTGGTTHAP